MTRALIPALCSLLVGCTTPVTPLTPYENLPITTYMTSGTTSWLIKDRPRVGRVLIQPDAKRTVAMTFVAGLSLGSFATELRRPEPEGALEQWLIAERRNCHITDGYPIATYQWEFRYTCP